MKTQRVRRGGEAGENRRGRESDTRAARLAEHHGLTPQETRVALLIAAALDVTVFTVRAHLRKIFVKMGVTRQAALVRMVLTTTEARESNLTRN